MFDFLRHGLHDFRALGWPVGLALGLGVPLASFLLGMALVVGLPSDFFVRPPKHRWPSHPICRLALLVGKNLLGLLVFVAGFIMALPLVPGPGVLFMLVGMALVDFPGKRALARRLLSERHVLSSVNRMRARFGKAPILTKDRGGQSSG